MGFCKIDPRMEGEKHSRIVEISLSDFCHEYHRQASPALQ
jgi:hypothetical protein